MRRGAAAGGGGAAPVAPGAPWIRSPAFDLAFIFAPALLATLAVLVFRPFFAGETSLVPWLVLVVGIDVAHVYSTLFRTYLDGAELRHRRELYRLTPILSWLAAVLLYAAGGALLFWRCLAYLAVFHFIRQQYGFMMLYKRRDRGEARWRRRLDQAVIYLATLCPLLWWHTHPSTSLHWFVDDDFLLVDAPWLASLAFGVYGVLLAAYALKELRGPANLPKNLLVLATAASWFVGIVVARGDFAFTVTNIVAHGVPYIALIWAQGRHAAERRARTGIAGRAGAFWFRRAALPAFIGLLLALGYVEEGLWDGLIWRDHAAGFPLFQLLPKLAAGALPALVVPLLAVPQMTHYILDGFIWKARRARTVAQPARAAG